MEIFFNLSIRIHLDPLFTGLHLQNMDGYFFIRIGTFRVVMDVDAFSTKPGTAVICYTQKDPPADNQLWTKEFPEDVNADEIADENADENAFYLVSKLSPTCKITIKVTISLVHFTPTSNTTTYACYLFKVAMNTLCPQF